MDLGNLSIKHDLQVSHLQTKTKLLEDALTNRNQDIELAEDNNHQLLNLLEKYDIKLDEL